MSHSEQTRLTKREWIISALLHVLVLGLIIWLTPARELIKEALKPNQPPPKPHQAAQDPTKVTEVVSQIDADQKEKAREVVRDLMHIDHQIDKMSRDRVQDYNKATQETSKSAAQKALDQLKQIPQDQDAALQAQKQMADQLKNLLVVNAAAPTQDTLNQLSQQVSALQQPVAKNQLATQDTQVKGLQMVHFTGQDNDASKAQENANQLETAAYDAQQAANSIQTKMIDNLDTQRWQYGNEKMMEDQAAQEAPKIDQANQPIAADQQAVNDAQAKFDAALKAANDARDFANTNKGAENFAKADQLNHEREQVGNELNHAKALLQQQQRMVQMFQNDHDGKLAQAKNWQDKVDDDKAQLAAMQTQLQAALDDASHKQDAAKQAQLDALTKIAALTPDPNANPAAAAVPPETPEEDPATLQDKNLAELVAKAKTVEQQITEHYQTERAATFAEIQKLTMIDALKATQVAKPHHEELNNALLATDGAVPNFAEYKAEVFKANQQLQSIASTADSMLSTTESDAELSKDDGALEAQKYEQMFAAAKDGEGSDARDLSGAMGQDDGGHGMEGDDSGKKPGGDGGFKSEETGGGKILQYPRNAPEVPNMDYGHIKPFPSRVYRETGGSQHADWFYVDSWYLIGPFPNEGRQNLNTKFPPESIVDLDATYPGKGGRPIKWVYRQWPLVPMNPPNDREDAPAIYYGYTEVIFDHPEDLWIATGSDDKGTMWINGIMVWNSGDTLKWWAPDEGFRRVHFREGRNRILYRLENGQFTAIFSLMISSRKN